MLMILGGCGGGGSSSGSPTNIPISPDGSGFVNISPTNIPIAPDSSGFVNISGTITYDKVPANSNYIGLDYNNITQEAAKAVQVDAVNASSQIIASTTTDASGNYVLSVPVNTQLKIRVSAKMLKAGAPSWDVKVVDNTNSDALYVMEGSLVSSGTTNSQRNLNASSGWDGSSYTSTRVAAPFAILDNAYKSIQKVFTANPNTVFPPLLMNWSKDNVSSIDYDPTSGQIITSHYSDGNLFILGDANIDTDEYDDHVVAHEWGHYYEDKLSRSDSIGGEHGGEDILDIRVAFSEGWGNAFSGMALENPVYFDTYDKDQAKGFNFDVESGTSNVKGWYSESSIERILYDLYDADDDGSDTLNLGFAPIHQVFIGAQKTTPAFTSIFTFITALKNENSGDKAVIDSIVSGESIAPIKDIYGTGRTNLPLETPNYENLVVGGTVNVCPTYTHGTYNKLGNRKYIRFDIGTAGNYTITVRKSNNSATVSDPDFLLYNVSLLHAAESGTANSEIQTVYLSNASYKLDISDYNNVPNTCFDVTVNK